MKTINLFLFQLSVSLFFIILGVMGVLPNVDESVYSLRFAGWEVELAVGIVEILCGAVLLYGLVGSPQRKTLRLASFGVLVFWIARIVYTRFLTGGTLQRALSSLEAFLNWALFLCTELIVLLAVWLIARRYED